MFAATSHYNTNILFAGKAGAYRSELHSVVRLVAFSANIRLGWKWLAVTNALAYYGTELILAEKCFNDAPWEPLLINILSTLTRYKNNLLNGAPAFCRLAILSINKKPNLDDLSGR